MQSRLRDSVFLPRNPLQNFTSEHISLPFSRSRLWKLQNCCNFIQSGAEEGEASYLRTKNETEKDLFRENSPASLAYESG